MYDLLLKNKLSVFSVALLSAFSFATADGWKENTRIFNPSGVPSLPFSQPRFADLDGDGKKDLVLGNSSDKPYYMSNVGTSASPAFSHTEDIFENVAAIDAEVAAFGDIDGDGDLDMVCGGYSGLNLYRNTGHALDPAFVKSDSAFPGLSPGHFPVPDLGDADQDGDLDLLLGFSEDGSIRVYFNSGSDTAALFLEGDSRLIADAGLYAYPVFCDLNGDGLLDIVSGRDGHGFLYFRNTGSAGDPNWQNNSSPFTGLGTDSYFNSPDILDMNGDGKTEIVYGNSDGPLLHYQNTGTVSSPVWTKQSSLFGGVLDAGGASCPFFIDLDGDGDMDMLTGSQMGDIKRFMNTGTPAGPAWDNTPSAFSALKHSIYSSVSFGDVNGDQLPDALVGDLSGKIYYHENTGSGFTPASSALVIDELGGWAAPRFIDMNSDGDLDIIAGNDEGKVFYYENQGSADSPLWSVIFNYFGDIDVGSNCVPAMADLDFDGDMDLIAGNISREVRYYENTPGGWTEDTLMFNGISGGQNTAPAAADLDGDGDKDLILGNYSGTFRYYENTHPVTAVSPSASLPRDYSLNAYPNPFNPGTNIRYTVPALSGDPHIRLSLYDLRGSCVAVLAEGKHAPGDHEYRLRPESAMSSGIYILRLVAGGKPVRSTKLIYLK